MPRIERDRELTKRRTRKVKILKLIAKYVVATGTDKEEIASKVRRISPFYELDKRVAELSAAGKLPRVGRPVTQKSAKK
ncbi:MAG: hypothetical protein Q8K78_15465 [Planctomycetaceae bacterium]|nr:hypothetical protein [Planctomycetaceae bacterium]